MSSGGVVDRLGDRQGRAGVAGQVGQRRPGRGRGAGPRPAGRPPRAGGGRPAAWRGAAAGSTCRSRRRGTSRCGDPRTGPGGRCPGGAPRRRTAAPRRPASGRAASTRVGRRRRGGAAALRLGVRPGRRVSGREGRLELEAGLGQAAARQVGQLGRGRPAELGLQGSFRRSSRRPPRFSRRPGRSSAQRLAARTRWTP